MRSVSNRFVTSHQLEWTVASCPVPTVRSVSSRRIRALADGPTHTRRLREFSRGKNMKKAIHPEYAPIVFNDLASGTKFLTRSTATREQTIEWEDGNTYPLTDVETSPAPHARSTGTPPLPHAARTV